MSINEDLDVKRNVSLASLTTLGVGGKCRYLARISGLNQLEIVVEKAKKKSLPIMVIGKGSNILVNDNGFDGLVIGLVNKSIVEKKNTKNHVMVEIGAGRVWDELVAWSVNKDYQGIECLSGIPGTAGASPVQNIGAYGQELKDVFCKLNAYDVDNMKLVELTAKECKFGYRDSIFKQEKYKGRYVIYNITLKLNKYKSPTTSYPTLKKYLLIKNIKNPNLKQVRESVLKIRADGLEDPSKVRNAGSFFKNPIISKVDYNRIRTDNSDIASYEVGKGRVKLSAGWLIEKAGWKGKKFGKVGVSKKNSLILINNKGKAKNIVKLSNMIQKDVFNKFKIKLTPEVEFVGFE